LLILDGISDLWQNAILALAFIVVRRHGKRQPQLVDGRLIDSARFLKALSLLILD
jgi:hypothetical protein